MHQPRERDQVSDDIDTMQEPSMPSARTAGGAGVAAAAGGVLAALWVWRRRRRARRGPVERAVRAARTEARTLRTQAKSRTR